MSLWYSFLYFLNVDLSEVVRAEIGGSNETLASVMTDYCWRSLVLIALLDISRLREIKRMQEILAIP